MKVRNGITIFVFLLTGIAFLFATPAVDIDVLGKNIKWDGLNLATITKDRYKGELQFKEGLDVRGGEKYILEADLDGVEEQNRENYAKDIAEKFALRLELYGFRQFDLRSKVTEDNKLELELLSARRTEDDSSVVQLLASKGRIEFWTEDPDYDPEVLEDNQLNFSFLQGMRPAELSREDIDSIESLYSGKANGYGFKIKFKQDAVSALFLISQLETSRGTMLVIDGQTAAFRTYQIENLDASSSSSSPVMYLSSLFGDSFNINDTIPAIFQTGELEQDMSLVSQEEVSPLLGSNFEWNLKLVSICGFILTAIVLGFKYRYLGIYPMVMIVLFSIWSLFFLKLFGSFVTLPLILGVFTAFLVNVLVHLDTTRKLEKFKQLNMKQLDKKLKEGRSDYRNFLLALMGFCVIMSFVPLIELSGLATGFGIGIVICLILLYLPLKIKYEIFDRF